MCFLLGIKSFTVNLETEQVIIESTLSTGQVQELIENSGRMAILRGLGVPGKTGFSIFFILFHQLYQRQGMAAFASYCVWPTQHSTCILAFSQFTGK